MPFDPFVPPGYSDVDEQWRSLADAHARVELALAQVKSNAMVPITLSGGEFIGDVAVEEFIWRFRRVSWHLFENTPQNGGVGAIASKFVDSDQSKWEDKDNWIEGSANIGKSGLKGCALHGESGLNFLILHEITHVTSLAIRTWLDCFKRHSEKFGSKPYDEKSAFWIRDEKVANNMAIGIADLCGITVLMNPNPGLFQRLFSRQHRFRGLYKELDAGL